MAIIFSNGGIRFGDQHCSGGLNLPWNLLVVIFVKENGREREKEKMKQMAFVLSGCLAIRCYNLKLITLTMYPPQHPLSSCA